MAPSAIGNRSTCAVLNALFGCSGEMRRNVSHTALKITPVFLRSRAPELNPPENIWQYICGNWLSNRIFETYEDIVDAACDAWSKLIAQPQSITIGMRNWAHVAQSH
jgi:hypothetical protein